MLTVIDEFSRECLGITVARRLNSDDVLASLTEPFIKHGPPAFIRSDNDGEFTILKSAIEPHNHGEPRGLQSAYLRSMSQLRF
jgi:transposase InsO family protein